ncbi:MAG: GTP cyclohydrolase II [Acidobacteria bacterium]|nr:GTP cyclohydrolase II [Acidobacteriota bacterium]
MVNKVAEVGFPTYWAEFRLIAFEGIDNQKRLQKPETLLALVLGDVQRTLPIVRIHSQCTTGDVFHSLRCDCHDQLHLALKSIANHGSGVLVYEHQEGRGIGLVEKLRAYELQDQGLDTIEANLELGHPVDLRNYVLPVEVLKALGIHSVQLLTNNPEKIAAVQAGGIEIVRRLSADVPDNPHSERYLLTKRMKLGHISKVPSDLSDGTVPPGRCRSAGR